MRQHTVPLAVFDVKRAELHGESLDLNVLIAELRELVEQLFLRHGVVVLLKTLFLEDFVIALKGVDKIEDNGAVG